MNLPRVLVLIIHDYLRHDVLSGERVIDMPLYENNIWRVVDFGGIWENSSIPMAWFERQIARFLAIDRPDMIKWADLFDNWNHSFDWKLYLKYSHKCVLNWSRLLTRPCFHIALATREEEQVRECMIKAGVMTMSKQSRESFVRQVKSMYQSHRPRECVPFEFFDRYKDYFPREQLCDLPLGDALKVSVDVIKMHEHELSSAHWSLLFKSIHFLRQPGALELMSRHLVTGWISCVCSIRAKATNEDDEDDEDGQDMDDTVVAQLVGFVEQHAITPLLLLFQNEHEERLWSTIAKSPLLVPWLENKYPTELLKHGPLCSWQFAKKWLLSADVNTKGTDRIHKHMAYRFVSLADLGVEENMQLVLDLLSVTVASDRPVRSYALKEYVNEVKYHLCRNPTFDEKRVEQHLSLLDSQTWSSLSTRTNLSLDFFERHLDKINWRLIGHNKSIPLAYLSRAVLGELLSLSSGCAHSSAL